MSDEIDPTVMESAPGPYTIIDGRKYLYFAGTGYLGLQGNRALIDAACDAVRRYGLHSATSRAGFGNQPPTLAVERLAAELLGAEGALYFISGYVGNHILASALGGHFQAVLLDRSAHYSVQEAARLAGGPVIEFGPRDPSDLAERLAGHVQPGEQALLMTDGVSPVTGRVAPLLEYREALAVWPGSAICIDDAHGLGVLGANGRGTLEHLGVGPDEINRPLEYAVPEPVRWYACGTLSKAIGGSGGIIAGSGIFVGDLKRKSHYYNGATPPAAPVAAATAEGLRLARQQPGLRRQLLENASYLREGLRGLGLPVEDLPTPIICLELDSAERMQTVQRELMRQGIVIAYFSSYSGIGPLGALRIAVFANHTREMLDQLVASLSAAL